MAGPSTPGQWSLSQFSYTTGNVSDNPWGFGDGPYILSKQHWSLRSVYVPQVVSKEEGEYVANYVKIDENGDAFIPIVATYESKVELPTHIVLNPKPKPSFFNVHQIYGTTPGLKWRK